jgi:hypothetical protein
MNNQFSPGAMVYTQGFGSSPLNVSFPFISNRAPTSLDVNFPIGKRWIDTLGETEHTLVSQSSVGGILSSTWLAGGNTLATTTTPGLVVLNDSVTMAAASNNTVPTSLAIKTYVDNTAIAGSPVSTEITAGIGQLATNVEAVAGTASTPSLALFLTPSNLASVFASPPATGSGTPSSGAFTTLSTSGLYTGSAGATINTGGSNSLNLATDNFTNAVNMATAGARTITLGSTAANAFNIRSGTSLTLSGTLGTSIIIGSGLTTGTIFIGSAAQTGTITLGSTNGSGTVNISNGTGASTVNIANVQNAGSFNVGTGMTTGTINIGGTAQTGTITIGNSSGANLLNIANGSGATTLSLCGVQTGGAVSIGTSMTDGTINIGGSGAQTGTITLAGGTAAQTLNIANSTGGKSVNIATGAGANTVVLGSTNTTSTTTINSGSGNINATGGHLSIVSDAKTLFVKGGAATDFVGTGVLTSGTQTIANTNIAAGDIILLSRTAVNASTTLGELTYTISAGASFTVTSVIIGTPGSPETGDLSSYAYFIVRPT